MEHESGFGRFWDELRRRRVVRAGGVYVAAAFVALQLGEIILPAFNTPDWALQSVVVFALLGLPVVLAFAWAYDITPQGFERTQNAPAQRPSVVPRIALLVVTTVSVGVAALWFSQTVIGSPSPVAGEGVSSFVSLDPDAPITAIAVLPLDNFSDGDDFFARQLHEEIISQLSQMTSLRVVSRTSVERYATTDKLLPEIAQDLRVQAIVEGSVTKPPDSETVRITIQLVHAPSDTHMLARTFERELKDILRLQTEVAQEIVRAIQGEVDSSVMEDVGAIAAVDPEAHQAFLEGQMEFERGTPDGLRAAIEHFGRAVAMDSTYSAPLAAMAGARVVMGLEGDAPLSEVLAQAHTEVQRAAALGGVEDEVEAIMVVMEDHMDSLPQEIRAEVDGALARSDSLTRTYVQNFTQIGRRAAQIERTRQTGETNEAVHRALMFEAQKLLEGGEYAGAAQVFRMLIEEQPTLMTAWMGLEDSYVLRGDYPGAVDVRADRILATRGDTPENRRAVEELRDAFDADDPRTYWEWRREDHAAREARGEYASDLDHAATCVALGDLDDALKYLESAVEQRDPAIMTLRTSPTWDPLRDDPRFRDVMKEARELWRRSGPVPPPQSGRPRVRRPN